MGFWEGFPYTNFHNINLDWVLAKMKDTVNGFEAVKKDSENTREKLVELAEYVRGYFANLDISEEVNNKLDVMAANGQLEEIVALYLEVNTAKVAKTVADMKVNQTFVNGSCCITQGFHTVNDGGGAFYIVTNIDNTMDVNGANIIPLDNPQLVAVLVDSEVNVRRYGAYGDGVNDDAPAIQAAIDNSRGRTVHIPDGVYLVNSALNVWRDLKTSISLDGATVRAGMAIPSVFNLGILRTEAENNYPDQTISGAGVIDCNSLAEIGIYIPSKAGYCRVSGVQIRHVKKFGIVIGEDGVSASTQCYITDVGVYGNYGDMSPTAIQLYGTDNILNNIHCYLCGVGLDMYSDVVDNLHVWNRVVDFEAADVANLIGVKVRGRLLGGTIYVDSVGTGIYLGDTASIDANALIYMTDTPIDNGVMINANYQSGVRLGYWYAKPENFAALNPLYLRSQPNAANWIGNRNFYGVTTTDFLRPQIEPCNELNNMATNPVPNGIVRNYSTINPESYYLLGYIRKSTSNVTLRIGITNVGEFEFTIHTTSGGAASLGDYKTLYGAGNGSFYVGAAIAKNGAEFMPVYYKPATSTAYNYITVHAIASGLNGFYPVSRSAPDQLEKTGGITSILEIPTTTA